MTTPPPPGHHPPPARPGGTVVVLTGGAATHPSLALPPADLVVAADSGARLAPALGLGVDLLVGDLDSIGESRAEALRAAGTTIQRHPEDKDATDLELALAVAAAHDPTRIVVVGGDGGRIDHAVANMGAIAAVAAPGRQVEAWMGAAHIALSTDHVLIEARVAETVSLVPLNGPATGVTTSGLRWPLDTATLGAGTTWGMSNEVVTSPARVSLGSGILAVIRPHALDPAADRHGAAPDRPAAVDPSSPLADRRAEGP